MCLTINQVVSRTQQKILQLERCFGVLVCPGRNVKQSDMQLLDMVNLAPKIYKNMLRNQIFLFILIWPYIGVHGDGYN